MYKEIERNGTSASYSRIDRQTAQGHRRRIRKNLRIFNQQDYPEYEVLLAFSGTAEGVIPWVNSRVASLTDCNVRTAIGTAVPA
ncbi:MAG TPA: hypothetical protein VEI57_01935 [Nitrospirota bacterium]|nr:hypothetical protein [Nitrospirota bacterium]